MEELFGISMQLIMWVLLALFGAFAAAILLLAWRNPVMLKLGLRNIPRRKAQTALIIAGIMISTLIMAASFGTGDTLTFSIRKAVVDGLGTIDEIVLSARADESDQFGGAAYVPIERFQQLQQELAGFESIDGLAPGLAETAPTINDRTALSEGGMRIAGVDPASLAGFGGFRLAEGGELRVEDLGAGEAYINEAAAEELDAVIGDALTVFVYGQRTPMTVAGIAANGGQANTEPTLLLHLEQAQELFGRAGYINSIVVSNTGDAYAGADLSEEVTETLRVLFTDRDAAAQLQAALARPEITEQLSQRQAQTGLDQTLRDDLAALRTELAAPVVSDALLALFSDAAVRREFLAAVDAAGDENLAREVNTLVENLAEFVVSDIKRTLLDSADQAGSIVTSFFILFGLFSIMVGVLLIFLIFVMLAAARRSEMGMARAVGAKRWHLVQMFVFEGTAYSVVSGAIGVGLGLLASALMVGIINQIFAGGGTDADDFQLTPNFEIRSMVVAYCLGMVITFATVGVSAYRVSRLNIVAAVRDLPAPPERSGATRRELLLGPLLALGLPLRLLGRIFRAVAVGQPGRAAGLLGQLALSPVTALAGLLMALTRLLSRPLSDGWLTFILGVLLTLSGAGSERVAFIRLGITLAIIGLGLLLRLVLRWRRTHPDLADRIGYTAIGLAVLAFWIVPFSVLQGIFGDLNAGIEMFFISGVSMVAAAVWTVMYNADLLVKALTLITAPFGSLRPILVTAIAYPMSAKFRTGLTLAMFALVIFTMIVMSILTEAFGSTTANNNAVLGGWDISARINPNTPIADLPQAIADHPDLDAGDIAAIGSYTRVPVQARQLGAEEQSWQGYAINIADAAYLGHNETEIHLIANGYGATTEEVWEALRRDPSLAVVDATVAPTRSGFGGNANAPEFQLEGFYYEDETMEAIDIEVREPATGAEVQLKVIGVMDNFATAFPALGGPAIVASRQLVDEVSPFPIPATHYRIQAAPGADIDALARRLEASFQPYGLESEALAAQIEESQSANQSFNYLLTGFMGLGLMVGIASLGVVSLRAVVERRQQIGVLRAIGYRKRMVQLTFLLESSFVVLLGVAIGIGLGTAISYMIVREVRQDIETIEFTLPWLQIVIIVAVAYIFSLATTFLPARQASQIYPAEALRYE